MVLWLCAHGTALSIDDGCEGEAGVEKKILNLNY